jgi:hypothetical protein
MRSAFAPEIVLDFGEIVKIVEGFQRVEFLSSDGTCLRAENISESAISFSSSGVAERLPVLATCLTLARYPGFVPR